MIIAADLVRVRVNMNEALVGSWNVEQGITLRGRLGHSPADEHHEIGGLNARLEHRIGRQPDFASVVLMLAVEGACAAKRAGHGELETLCEASERRASTLGPARPSKDRNRSLCAPKKSLQLDHLQRLLWSAERPIAILGGPGWTERASAAFARFAQRFELPVAGSFRRASTYDGEHENYAGE